ncbi:MAG: hypothetical protein ACLRXA_22955 [Clostridium sp.]
MAPRWNRGRRRAAKTRTDAGRQKERPRAELSHTSWVPRSQDSNRYGTLIYQLRFGFIQGHPAPTCPPPAIRHGKQIIDAAGRPG